VIKQKKYIDMIKLELPAGDQPTSTRMNKSVLNPCVLNYLGDQISHLTSIWVDDALVKAP
jgi:hypothetical protein